MRHSFVALALLASACTATPGVTQSPSPTVAASVTTTPTATPVAPASSAPASTTAASPTGAPAVLSVTPLGRLSGQIAWVVNAPSLTTPRGLTTLELWAMPLDGSAPRMAVRYASTQVGLRAGPTSDTNVLRHQFSPDGRRIVLSVAIETNLRHHVLVLIDLEAGRATQLIANADADYINPVWSPDGSKIAFLRATAVQSTEIWVMNADGTGARRLRGAAQGTSTPLFGWTADSTQIGFAPIYFERSAFALIDLSGAVSGETPANISPNSNDPVDWHKGSPAFAMSYQDPSPLPTRSNVIVGDDPAQRSQHIIADVVVNPTDNNVIGVRDPRWDPSGKFRVIYIETGILGAFVLNDFGSGSTQKFAGRVFKAEWLPDGTVVTLEEHPSTAPLSVFHYDVDRKAFIGNNLFLSDLHDNLIDLAPRSY
jgi:dipeptidyl aminopeptidase/acylaminoacyl peptidase